MGKSRLRHLVAASIAVAALGLLGACAASNVPSSSGTANAATVANDTKPHRCHLGNLRYAKGPGWTCVGSNSGLHSIGALTPLGSNYPKVSPSTFGDQPDNAFLQAASANINAFLKAVLSQAGFHSSDYGALPTVTAIKAGKTVTTRCSGAGDNGSAVTDGDSELYCPAQNEVFLALPVVQANWFGNPSQHRPAIGRSGTVFMLAHEKVGHYLQQILGINRGTPVTHQEQEADCLSGVYLASAVHLTSTGLKAVIAEARYFASPSDGTPDQREAAVMRGYNSRNPASCYKKYEIGA